MLRNVSLLFVLSLSVVAAPKVVRLEAETAAGLSEQVRVLKREDASGGACLQLGVRGARNDAPKEREADASLSATVPWQGPTVVWGRVLAPNGGSDSLYVAGADGSFKTLSLKAGKDWTWTVLHRTRPAADGSVALRLQYRELGVLMDEIALVSGRDLLPDEQGRFRRKDVKNPYADPPFLPPKEHPRVFLRRQDIPALRAKLTGPAGEALRAELEKQADQPGDGVLPEPKSKERGNFNRGAVGRTILANAYLGLLDGDDARRKRAVEMFANYFRTLQFPDRHDVTRDYGEVLMTGGLVYDWCYDLLTPAWKEQFLEDALELASRTEIGYPPTRQGAVTSHGGEAQLMRDQFAVAVAVYDEFPEWYRIGAGRFFQEFVPARNFFFPSHRHHQGDSYGPYRFQWSMFATWLFDRMGAGPVFTAEQGSVLYAYLYMRRPDGQLIRDGDTFLSGRYWQFPLAMMLTASYYHDPRLEYEYRRQCAVSGRDVPALWRALFHDPKLEPKPLLDLPLTKFFPEPLGGMIARTGWRQGVWSRAVVCEMKGAGYHFNNHHHLDAGGFQIYYRGGLATDAGCYGHYGILYDWCWNKRSIAHNTLLLYDPAHVDATKHDGGQNYPNRRREPGTLQILKEKGYKDGSVLAHAFGPDRQRPFFSHIKTDLTPGYADRAERIERSCVFLNLADTADAGLLVVLDRMVAKDAKLRPVWLLHGVEKPEISGSRATFLRTDGNYAGRLVSDTLLPADAQITPIGGSTAEGKVFDTVFEADKPTTESGGWRIEVSPREQTTSTLFLHALQVGDATGAQASLAQRIETDQLLGARVGNELVLFAKNGELLAGPLGLAISGSAPVRVVVTDLVPGFWSAARDGKAVHQTEATRTGQTICLRLVPGTYQLTRSAQRSLPEAPQAGLVPPSVDATVPEVIDGNLPLSLSGVVRETSDGPLVALQPVAEALGARVRQNARQCVVLVGQAQTILSRKAREAQCGGQAIALARAPEEAAGQLWVGLDALGLAVRRPCRWDSASGVVVVDRLADGQLFVQRATASHANKPGTEKLALDRNPRTYWAAQEDGSWLQVDLGVPATVRSVGIDWLHSDARRVRFEIQASLDGTAWQEIFAGKSDGKTPGVERVPVPATNARYLRIVGHGNDQNHWNSIREITVWSN
jgi:heparin/heparan-sulfate lyase